MIIISMVTWILSPTMSSLRDSSIAPLHVELHPFLNKRFHIEHRWLAARCSLWAATSVRLQVMEGPYHLWIPRPVLHPLRSVLILTKVIPFCLALPVPPLPFDEPVVFLLIWPQTPARPTATPKSSPTALAIATPLSPMAIPNATPPIPMSSPIATPLSSMAIPITMPLSHATTSLTSTPPTKNGFTDSHASCQNGFTDSHASRHSSFTDSHATHHNSFINSRASPYISFNNSYASMPPYGNTQQYRSIPLNVQPTPMAPPTSVTSSPIALPF